MRKIFNDYVSYKNKKIIFYFFRCEFTLQFDKDFTEDVKTMYLNNEDIASIKKQLLYIFYYFISRGCKFINIKQKTIFSLSCRCNMKYE